MLSMRNVSISDLDTMAPMPKKLLSHKTMNALLPDLTMLLNSNFNFSARMDPASEKKLSKSFADLELLVREAQVRTSCSASKSMSKLDQPIKTVEDRGVPAMNPLTHNTVFTVHIRGAPKTDRALKRRRTQVLKIRKVVADRRRTKELKLDDMGSLRCMMEEFRKQKKAGKCNYNFDTDSDDEDLDE